MKSHFDPIKRLEVISFGVEDTCSKVLLFKYAIRAIKPRSQKFYTSKILHNLTTITFCLMKLAESSIYYLSGDCQRRR